MILELRTLYFEDLSVGMTERLSKTVSSSDVVGFAEVTGDRNPIHLSEHFAAKTQFGTRIAHGLYTASLISAVLGTRLPGPGAVYISQTLNFRAPVTIGDTVDVTVTVAELIPERQRARLSCTCKVANETVLDGEALVQEGEERLLHGGVDLPVALDVHRGANGHQLCLDRRQLRAVEVLQHEGLADPEDLAIDLEHGLAAVVLDPEVLPDREQLPLQLVSGPALVGHRLYQSARLTPGSENEHCGRWPGLTARPRD